VDTGTEVSLLPAVRSDRRTSGTGTIPPLVAANGSVIKLYSKRTLPLNLCGQRFEGEFIVANVRQAILGADFLRASGLLVDMAGERLIHAAAYAVVNAPAALCSTVNVAYAVHAVDPVYAKLLAEFPTLESVNFSTPTVAHGVKLSIDTGSTMPIRTPARRLNPEKYKVAKELFDDMLKLGIIRRPKSQWVSPLHVVSKADGEWRPCGDYRQLNGLTKTDSYQVPHIQDFAGQLLGAKIFSKVDLVHGYHQIPVAEADICKTAVITPFGLFEFPRTPFGLCNAAQAFQRMMDTTLAGLPFIFVYIDDILVASATREQHLKDLREVFERLAANGLSVKPSKCLFGQEAVRFLSHEVDANGVRPQTSKVDAVKRFPQPETVKGLQGFLGMVNYYHRFIPRAARVMQPMYDLLKGKPARNAVVNWTAEAKAAFTSTKAALASATMLVHPRVGAELVLTVNA
jgi:cleavage and polyadenylation specificity factor subunit 1